LTTPFTWPSFKSSFLEAWSEANETQTTKDKLKCMKQKGTYSSYITKFNHYALLKQFDELALKELFYDGCKEGVKDLLLMHPEVITLYKYQKQAVKCDILLFKAAKSANGTFPRTKPFPPPCLLSSSLTQGDDPMEIGVTHISNRSKSGPKDPLTDAEKQWHRYNHLCMYCGSSDCAGAIKLKDCPRLHKHTTREMLPAELKRCCALGSVAFRQSLL
jgi:hypothetical protein